jgi:pyruvate formate lyase activating enzyme
MTLPVFDVVRGSFLDGDGIRTVIFLQGCPLKCLWCHNPESQSSIPSRKIQHYRTEELHELILRDKSYYQVSNGGVTFSGGEPLLHIQALKDLVKALWEDDISVAFDTSGFFDYEAFKKDLLPYTQDLLYDLKIMDTVAHKRTTGQTNDVILQNLRQLVGTSVHIRIRIPLIPGITAIPENLQAIAQFMKSLGLQDYDLIPYNPSCIDKLKKMGLTPDSSLPKQPMSRAEELRCKEIMNQEFTPTPCR